MINTVYNITTHLINLYKEQDLVNTVTRISTDRIDSNKQNIYPLVNIDLIDSTIVDNITTISYLITIVEQREIGNVLDNNKLFGDNYIDNISECHLIASKSIKSFNTNTDIFMDNIPTISFIDNAFENGLDGVQFNLILSATNEEDCE